MFANMLIFLKAKRLTSFKVFYFQIRFSLIAHPLRRRRALEPIMREAAKPAKSAYHEFVRKGRAAGQTIREIAADWRTLTPEEMAEHQPKRDSREAMPAKPSPAKRVWPYCGDEFYPISARNIADASTQIGILAQRWTERVGSGAIQAAGHFDAELRHLCEAIFGRAQCRTMLTELEVATRERWHKALLKWARMARPKSHKYNEAWSALGMCYMGPAVMAAAGADAPPADGYVTLCLDADLSATPSVALCMQPSIPLQPGHVIDIDLSRNRLVAHQKWSRYL